MSVSTPRAVVTATPVAAYAAFLFGIGAVGCSSFDAEGDTCEDFPGLRSTCDSPQDGNGGSVGTAPSPLMPAEWQCLVTEDAPVMPAMPGRVTYIAPVVDFDTSPLQGALAVPGVQLTVCTTASCATPAGPPEVIIQQADPANRPFLWAINMPYGLGAVSIRATAPGFVGTDYYLGGPMVGTPEGSSMIVGLPLPLTSVAARDALLAQLDLPTPADPDRGILALRTLNCNRPMGQGERAERVRVELVSNDPPEDAVPWVLSFGNQASRDIVETDDRGVAGFANLPPRAYSVRGIAPAPRNSETGTPYGLTLATVRPNTTTLVEIREGLDIWGQ
jgi:hypothetical protein